MCTVSGTQAAANQSFALGIPWQVCGLLVSNVASPQNFARACVFHPSHNLGDYSQSRKSKADCAFAEHSSEVFVSFDRD